MRNLRPTGMPSATSIGVDVLFLRTEFSRLTTCNVVFMNTFAIPYPPFFFVNYFRFNLFDSLPLLTQPGNV